MPYYRNDRDDMSALSIVTRVAAAAGALQRLQGAEQEQENAQMRGMLLERELQGPSERDKFQWERAKFSEQQRAEQIKYALTKFSELSKESSPATKAVMMGHMENIHSMMTPVEREVSRMVLAHSPLNPIEQKATWWDNTMRAPQVNADPTKDLYAYGLQVKNLKDFQRQKTKFVTGEMPPDEKLFSIAEGMFVYTGTNGKTQILSSADLGLAQVAEENGTTPGALVASGGIVYTPDREINVSGHIFKTRTPYNAIERKVLPAENVPIKTGERNLDAEENMLKDFAVAYANQDTDGKTPASKLYIEVKARQDQGEPLEWIAKNILTKRFPGFNFAVVDPGTFSSWPIWGGYSPSKTEVLTYWRGEETAVYTKDNVPLGYYYDHLSSKVMDNQGRVISNDLPSLIARVGSMTEAEIIEAAKGGKGTAVEEPKALVTPRPVAAKPPELKPMESAESDREKKFQAQTEKITENLKGILKWLEENTGKGTIPRTR